MTTLFDVLYGAMLKIGQVKSYICTGGTTGTAVSTDLTADFATAADLANVALFVTETSDGLAPQGEAKRVSLYTPASGTLAVPTNFTAAVASGDEIAVGRLRFPYLVMVRLANQVLSDLGTIPLYDVSLTTAANTTEYSLPVALKTTSPRQIWIQGDGATASDGRWWELKEGWRLEPTAAGVAGKLILPELDSGKTIKIVYDSIHPAVTSPTGTINEAIQLPLLKEMLIQAMRRYEANVSPSNNPAMADLRAEANAEAENARRTYKIKKGARHGRMLPYGYELNDDDS